MGIVIALAVMVVLAVLFLKGFDRIAGRGPKQVSDGIRDSGIGDKVSGVSVATEIDKLAQLRTAGVLSEDEFQAQKKKVLG